MTIEAVAPPAKPAVVLERPALHRVPPESTRIDHATESFAARLMASRAVWLTPVLVLQLTLIARLDARGPLAPAQLGAAVAILVSTVLGYFAIRRWFGQGAALAGSGIFAVSASTLLAAWTTTATPYGVLVLAIAMWLVSNQSRSSENRRAAPAVLWLAVVAALSLTIAGVILTWQGHWQPVNRPHRTAVIHGEIVAVAPVAVAAAIGIVVTRRRLLALALFAAGMVPVGHQIWLGDTGGLHQATSLSVVVLAPLVGVAAMALLRRGRYLGPRVVVAAVYGAVLLATGMTSSDGVVHDRTHPNASTPQAHQMHSQPVGSRYAP